MRVGHLDLGNLFAGEIGWEATLPELVLALDFSFSLGCWGIKETNVVEFESPAELGQCVGIFGEKQGVIIDVDLQWATVGQEGGGQEIKVGEQEFTAIDFGSDEEAAAIVEHIEHGKIQGGGWEPAMRRGVQLPELADLGTLPAAHWGVRALGGSWMGIAMVHGPATNLGAIELEGVQSQGFRGDETVRARRVAAQTFFKEAGHRLGPNGGMVTPGGARDPQGGFLVSAGVEVIGDQ